VANPAIATHAMNPCVIEKRFFTLFIIVTARSASSRIAGFSLGSCRAFATGLLPKCRGYQRCGLFRARSAFFSLSPPF